MSDPVMTVQMCHEVHRESLQKFDAIQTSLNELNRRLFKDNGALSVQTRIDRQGRTIAAIMWVVGVISATILTQLVMFGSAAIKHVLKLMP